MTTFKRTSKTNQDDKFKRGLIFYLCAFIFIVIAAILVLTVSPSRTKHQEPSITPPNTISGLDSESKPIDNSSLEIPVLMYHYIRQVTDPNDSLGKNLSVTPETFDKQLAWLKDHGYEAITFDKALDIFANKEAISNKPVIITFDDGYKDAYTAAMPSLLKHNLTGIFYVISAFIMRDQHVSFDDISMMIENKMTIGCHTLDHVDLTAVNPDRLQSELVDCKESLANVYSIPVSDFSYPSGKYNDEVENAVKAAGFKTATTTHSGVWKQSDDPYQIPRIRMSESTNLSNILK